jgi:hypothetical protein
MDDDATVAMRRDGNGQRDELSSLFVQLASLGVGGAQRLVSPDGVRAELCQLPASRPEFFVVLMPIKHHQHISWLRLESLRADPFDKHITQKHLRSRQLRISEGLLGANLTAHFGVLARYGMFCGSRKCAQIGEVGERRGISTGSTHKSREDVHS